MKLDEIVWIFRKELPGWVTCENVLSDEEVALILTYGMQLKPERGIVKENNTQEFKEMPLRCSEIAWVFPKPETEWLYKKLNNIILEVNAHHFNFNLLGLQALQFSSYKFDELGHYGKHADTSPTDLLRFNRKLSFSIQLSGADEYEGGDLFIHAATQSDLASKNKGSITFFPSNKIHEVTPVTSGVRHSLVGWVVGPEFI
jgi:PKHD-type hydroxylase